MRNKPTIIAFKTPGMKEKQANFDQDNGSLAEPYTLVQAEEGKIPKGKKQNLKANL